VVRLMLTTTLSHVAWVGGPVRDSPRFLLKELQTTIGVVYAAHTPIKTPQPVECEKSSF